MQRYSKLRVWRDSHLFLLDVYRLTAGLPADERYGLSSQLRRATLSVPTNIVEGSKRVGRQDYARFLNLAEASLAEAEYLLVVCHDLGYIAGTAVEPLVRRAKKIARRLHALRQAVSSHNEDPSSRPGEGVDAPTTRADASASPSTRGPSGPEPLNVSGDSHEPSTRARAACLERSERAR
jgi:carbamoyl-phosphate synthase large subunit